MKRALEPVRGFALLELPAVIVIIGLMALLGFAPGGEHAGSIQ